MGFAAAVRASLWHFKRGKAMQTEIGPREKMARWGAAQLSDAELLAVLFQTGQPGENHLQQAQRLIGVFGNLGSLMRAPQGQLLAQKGIGPARASLILAYRELTRRITGALPRGTHIQRPADLRPWIVEEVGGLNHEAFGVAFLDTHQRLIAIETLFLGSLTQTSVYPRSIASRALQHNAGRLVLFHNHPSGEPSASRADIQLTQRLQEVFSHLEISIWEHLVVADGEVYGILQPSIRDLI